MDKYLNRKHAGQILADALKKYSARHDVIVLALPRGGVPVAYKIAQTLQAPLDVFIVRKLGVPEHVELAMGAIATGDTTVFNQDIISQLGISIAQINAVIENEKIELQRREQVYRGNHVFPVLKNKIVILVDDGIATGATMRVAINAVRKFSPAKLIVAVPVSDITICQEMEKMVDEFVCPICTSQLNAVGVWYDDFSQTEDAEVHELLQNARKFVTIAQKFRFTQ